MNDIQLNERLQRLSPDKRRLLALRISQQDRPASTVSSDGKSGEDLRLVAHIVPTSAGDVDITELRRKLAEKLPAYMIPSQFLLLEALPLTPNGKVDLNHLLALDASPTNQGSADESGGVLDFPTLDFIEPRNDREREIALIWASLLGIDVISVEDNFFDLGGHSLLVMRMLAQLREQFGVEITASSFFQNPTIANLASLIQALQMVQSDPSSSGGGPRESFEL